MTQGELIGRQGKHLVSIPLPQIEIPRFRFGAREMGGVGQGEGEPGDRAGRRGRASEPGAARPGGRGLARRAGRHPGRGAGAAPHPAARPPHGPGREGQVLEHPARGPGEPAPFQAHVPRGAEARGGDRGLRPRAARDRARSARTAATAPGTCARCPSRTRPSCSAWTCRAAWATRRRRWCASRPSGSTPGCAASTSSLEQRLRRARGDREGGGPAHLLPPARGGRHAHLHRLRAHRPASWTRASPPDAWNVYLFHFSDGENGDSRDTEACLELLDRRLLPRLNLFCFGQVRSSYGGGRFKTDLDEGFPGARGRGHERDPRPGRDLRRHQALPGARPLGGGT